MTTKSDAFKQHKNKVIESYICWEKCLFLKIKVLAIARSCADNILQALVIDKFDITEFTKASYNQLKSQGYFTKEFKWPFGTTVCRYLLTTHTKLLDKKLEKDFTYINDLAVDDIHYTVSITDEKFDLFKNKLSNVVTWFFREYEEELNWRELYINSELNSTPSRLMSKQIAEYLEEIRNEKNVSLENVKNLEVNRSSEIKMFAKRIYIELITRKVAIPIDEDSDVVEELYNSWYKLFCIMRDEIKALPISCIKDQSNPESAHGISLEILNGILRPHLTEHQARFRSWLEKAKQNKEYENITPQALQRKYPDYSDLMKSLKKTNEMLIDSAKKLFELVNWE